jgi:hypothetical protein
VRPDLPELYPTQQRRRVTERLQIEPDYAE